MLLRLMRIIGLSLFIFFTLVSCKASSSDWSELSDGFFYRKDQIQNQQEKNSNPSKATLHVFKVDPQKYEFKALLAKNKSAFVREISSENQALLTVNANFFDPQSKPLGLVMNNNKVLNAAKSISWWGLFKILDDKASILHSSEYQKDMKADLAIQAGPRLVIKGNVPQLKTETSPKTAIGISKEGFIFIMISLDSLEIRSLAKHIRLPVSRGGLGIENALNLDGGSSSQAYAKIDNFELDLPSFVKVPVALGVFKKERPQKTKSNQNE